MRESTFLIPPNQKYNGQQQEISTRKSMASSPLGLHRFRPNLFSTHQSLLLIKQSLNSQNKIRRIGKIRCCQTTPNPPESSSTKQEKNIVDIVQENGSPPSQTEASLNNIELPEYPTRNVNKQVAVVSVLAAVGLFLSARLDFGVSLKDLSALALPYEEALSNGKPTVVEFYADWCEVCKELAPDVYNIEQKYKDRVNFVMLNVDNTKWEQELDEFGVEGVPHFAFLDRNGNEEGNVVGRLPRQYFLENVDALAQGKESIPHARIVGQFTSSDSRKVHQVVDPRSHG